MSVTVIILYSVTLLPSPIQLPAVPKLIINVGHNHHSVLVDSLSFQGYTLVVTIGQSLFALVIQCHCLHQQAVSFSQR